MATSSYSSETIHEHLEQHSIQLSQIEDQLAELTRLARLSLVASQLARDAATRAADTCLRISEDFRAHVREEHGDRQRLGDELAMLRSAMREHGLLQHAGAAE